MDDNEAEVNLHVSASILNAGHTDTTNDAANECETVNNDAAAANNDDDNNNNDIVTDNSSINQGNEYEELSNIPNEVDDGIIAIEENGDNVNVVECEEEDDEPAQASSTRSSDGSDEASEIQGDEPAAVLDEEVPKLADNQDEETVIGVCSPVSKDHISPASTNIIVTRQTGTGTDQEGISDQCNENSGGIETAIQDVKEERAPSPSVGKIFTTTITTDFGDQAMSVKIVDATYNKPFLGGFRHKHTGVEYLNASSQTYPKKVIPKTVEVFTRDTQTVQKKNQMQQTTYNTSTQMTKPGCYVSDEGDVIRIPGKYVSSAEQETVKIEKVIVLQSYWRRWLASQYVKKLRNDRDMRIEWELSESKRIAAERVDRLRSEFERRMKPTTKADFDLLYAALERWRQEEIDRINNSHSGPERKAALIALLEQEAYLIQSIERHRLNADEQNYSENVVNFLDKAARPKFWRAFDGRKTEMNTKYSLRAQELRDIYNTLQMKYLNQDERLDILLTLKHTVKEHDCKLTQELIELIDREADLLTRNVKSSNLEGLRQRISTLFLQYCKTPQFNPDVARLLKVPQEPSTLRKDIYFCPSCNSYLPSSEFPLASNSRIVGRCKKCSQLDNNARLRHDFTKIRNILQHLRRTEEVHNDGSKIAFIIQDADLSYLIEKIWNSQSALSGLEELYDLVFVRWNKYEHWSPWNCVLLTKEEASAHMKLEGVSEAYGRIFIGKVHHRHVVAKQYFSKLTKISNDMGKKKSNIVASKNRSTAVV